MKQVSQKRQTGLFESAPTHVQTDRVCDKIHSAVEPTSVTLCA